MQCFEIKQPLGRWADGSGQAFSAKDGKLLGAASAAVQRQLGKGSHCH